MKIEILAFAWLREALGTGQRVIEVPDGDNAAEIARLVLNELGETAPPLSSLRLAVNDELVENDHVVHDGDRLALIPPVSGG